MVKTKKKPNRRELLERRVRDGARHANTHGKWRPIDRLQPTPARPFPAQERHLLVELLTGKFETCEMFKTSNFAL